MGDGKTCLQITKLVAVNYSCLPCARISKFSTCIYIFGVLPSYLASSGRQQRMTQPTPPAHSAMSSSPPKVARL
jgi:hypothetical protein